ncbi:hypothetical protein DPMN_041179 [Dreissena polymorpha]|uniref:Uncharacterized protein n=1 Tax=Dreissena polymorpha TaxID=45954 RepID=A0A9D4CYY9_DREPO|nr:hypothetical protein DPMN_041179 [Dreissena polymorpha]
MNNKWPLGGHDFLTDLNHLLEKNVSSRLFTCCHYIHIKKTAPLPGGHVFSLITTIFKLVRDIHITNAKHLTSREKDPPPPGGHVFLLIQTIIKLNCPIQEKFPAPNGSHVCQAKVTIFELIQDIIGMNLLTNVNKLLLKPYKEKCPAPLPPPLGHVFQPTDIIFELVEDIIGMNLLTKFYEDRTVNEASRVLTRFCYSHIRKNAPPLGSHVFQPTDIIFELVEDIIETNLLTKFYEDWTINVASRE